MAITISQFADLHPYLPFDRARKAQKEEEDILKQHIENQYEPEKLRIANALKQNELNFAPEVSKAELEYKKLFAPALIEKINRSKIENQFLPEEKRLGIRKDQQALEFPGGTDSLIGMLSYLDNHKEFTNHHPDIAKLITDDKLSMINARNNRGSGFGSRTGVDFQTQRNFEDNFTKDNPSFNPDQLREGVDRALNGYTTLSDGTPIRITKQTELAGNAYIKRATGQKLTDNEVTSINAEKELPILNKYASDWTKPYGSTIFGYSPSLIKDSTSNARSDQERIGKFLAGRALDLEGNNLRFILANAKSTVHAMESMEKSLEQSIKSSPVVSAEAKNYARSYLQKALSEALNARLENQNSVIKTRQNQRNVENTKENNNDPLGIL